MKDLIEALERAEGPSRELDARIWALDAAIPGELKFGYEDYNDGARREHVSVGSLGTWLDEIPNYTASIDAALTLVPDRMAADICVGPKGLAFEVSDAKVYRRVQSKDEQGVAAQAM